MNNNVAAEYESVFSSEHYVMANAFFVVPTLSSLVKVFVFFMDPVQRICLELKISID